MFFIDAFDFFMPFFSGINIIYKGLYVLSFLPLTMLAFYMLFIEDEDKGLAFRLFDSGVSKAELLPDMICTSLLLAYLFPLTLTIFALVFFAGIIYSIWQSITTACLFFQKAAYQREKQRISETRRMKEEKMRR